MAKFTFLESYDFLSVPMREVPLDAARGISQS